MFLRKEEKVSFCPVLCGRYQVGLERRSICMCQVVLLKPSTETYSPLGSYSRSASRGEVFLVCRILPGTCRETGLSFHTHLAMLVGDREPFLNSLSPLSPFHIPGKLRHWATLALSCSYEVPIGNQVLHPFVKHACPSPRPSYPFQMSLQLILHYRFWSRCIQEAKGQKG